ncbi:sulfite reductase [NADPH] flavoprotein alpha-component [Coraliomargarita sinensis]|uniref:assimilatory sulfite reductase (NADPH) n=1 Tax=Coraliomargarita sinensis TaxID=2174842 RepID=A0A317ZJ91_9BACT|nr:assimilatory sulfite reductase (NADPH) flavoprotein subunit [Coraliomargarita sinensis]PXA04293.1 sulfite reductase [NADPH] flavoprotein alpha-component [Coraliomargarita sinensis]
MSNSDSIVPGNNPLRPEQANLLNQLLPGLAPEQMMWLEGFVSGLRAGQGGPAAAAAQQPATSPELTVLYGTESGNSESLADQTVKAAKGSGFKAKAVNMADLKVAKLKDIQNLLVIVSTWGEGDPPETAVDFYEEFMSDKAPKLENTRFSVLGLGDTSYEHFCKMGKDFDSRLEALGAKRIYDRKDCDVDYDDDYEAWHAGALKALEAEAGASATATAPAAATAAAAPVKYSRKNPFPAELKERVLLNGKGSAKETIHLEFDLEGSGLTYETGDALAVIPHNASDVVEDLLKASKLDGDTKVSLKDGEFSLHEALTSHLDITALSKPVLSRYNEFAKSDELDAVINDKEKLSDFIYGRDVVDLLTEYPAKELTADALVGIMRKLPPRLYSIASSPKAHPDEVHLTVGVVRYSSNSRPRKGVCSTYLAERIEEGQKAEVFVSPNKNFKLPADPDTPVIMVGPGTGIAPFRAFIEERQATGAKGKNWLFFGDQHYLTDFLYQTEWQSYLADGILTKLDVAFSRDQKHKIYVQDRMRENAKELYAWLLEGAKFYVCGDANRMAHDVDQALHDIVEQEGGFSKEEAADYVKQLKTDKRYLRDVY